MLKGASQAIGIQSLFADLNVHVGVRLCTDASASKALAEKKGLGKTKHLQTQYLCLQDRAASKDVFVSKINARSNRSDLLIKYLAEPRVSALLNAMGCKFLSGKHRLALSTV